MVAVFVFIAAAACCSRHCKFSLLSIVFAISFLLCFAFTLFLLLSFMIRLLNIKYLINSYHDTENSVSTRLAQCGYMCFVLSFAPALTLPDAAGDGVDVAGGG